MQVREITEGWFDALDAYKELRATQAKRQNLPDLGKRSAGGQGGSEATGPGEILPDPGNVLVVTMINGKRYFKDINGAWFDELGQRLPYSQIGALEGLLAQDRYVQTADPRIPAGMQKPARRKVSRRRGMSR